jgi:sulfite exporter TauE/SafE
LRVNIDPYQCGPGHPGASSTRMENLQWLGSLCTHDTALQGGLLLGLFAAGAAGSVVHCGPMCGVFVLGQVSERMAHLPSGRLCERQRIGSGLLLPYHLGRLTTYAGLGALAASSAAVFGHLVWFGGLSAVLLTIAALMFLTQALGRFVPAMDELTRLPRFWGRLIGIFAKGIPRGSLLGGICLGWP